MNIATYGTLFMVFKLLGARRNLDDYEKKRTDLINAEKSLFFGSDLPLNDVEIKLNEYLMELKEAELEKAFKIPDWEKVGIDEDHYRSHLRFNLSQHYFTYRDQIKTSTIYRLIKMMPKGAALHIHSLLILDADFMLQLTYEDHLYACYSNADLLLLFSDTIPKRRCQVNWTLLSELRNASNDIKSFDEALKKHFTIYPDGENFSEFDTNTVWVRLDMIFYNVQSLISYRPVFQKYLRESLKRFYEDDVMYVELRVQLNKLYELNGTEHDTMYTAKLYESVTYEFIKRYPDFVGVKLILTTYRIVADTDVVQRTINMARELKAKMPNLIAGVDIVGQEDFGNSLQKYLPALLNATDEINFYFHGGETNWHGMPSDENLFDAVLLGSKRIGHAYALTKHPSLITTIKEKNIVLEVNVISNAVLELVSDIRNHPLAIYLAYGIPIVLSSDCPGAWGADPLSSDFYVAFMAVTSKHADLRMLKQLAMNSIKYSNLDDFSKTDFSEIFELRWQAFLRKYAKLALRSRKERP